MTETIQTLKEDIAILQEKLQKLEEQDPEMLLLRQGNIDIVDYDGKKYFRIEYTDSFAGEYSWYVRRVGEDAIRPVRDVNVYAPLEELYKKEVVKQKDDYPYKKYTPEKTEKLQEKNWYVDAKTLLKPKEPEKEQQIKELVRESVKWCEEHPDESVEDYLKPHTPEKTEKSLRTAFVKAQQTEEWKETQRKIDGKNPPEFLKFELRQNLTDLIYDWWEDVFVKNSNDDMENCIGRLVYWIEEWLPKEQSAAGSQNAYVECSVEGFNDAINKIRRKLR